MHGCRRKLADTLRRHRPRSDTARKLIYQSINQSLTLDERWTMDDGRWTMCFTSFTIPTDSDYIEIKPMHTTEFIKTPN